MTVAPPQDAHGQSLTVSGGIDGRFTHESAPADTNVELTGLFLNLRKVWSDDVGDRWIGVGQVDFDHNFQDVRPYQLYLQYKGPLGKWNVRAGHFLLPFGLLATYDTERLVLQGLEEASLGIRKDTGVQALGHCGRWDYAVALTLGVGDRRLLPVDSSRLLTGRLAYVGDTGQVGLSFLAGRLLPDAGAETGGARDEWRLGADATKSLGRLTLRAEALGGATEGRAVGGGVVLADYALRPKLELNTRAAYWREESEPSRWASASRTDPGPGSTYGWRTATCLAKGTAMLSRLRSTSSSARPSRRAFFFLLGFLLLAAPLRADVCVRRDPERTMQRLFPAARDYKTVAVKMTPDRIAAVERALGGRLDDSEKTEISFYDITGGSDKPRVIGTVLALAGKGQYGAIEVVIGLDADARIVGTYIQRSRERATKALQSPEFLKQFEGKTKSDAFQVGKDLKAASADAEVASKVVAGVVKKMVVFNDVLRVGGSR